MKQASIVDSFCMIKNKILQSVLSGAQSPGVWGAPSLQGQDAARSEPACAQQPWTRRACGRIPSNTDMQFRIHLQQGPLEFHCTSFHFTLKGCNLIRHNISVSQMVNSSHNTVEIPSQLIWDLLEPWGTLEICHAWGNAQLAGASCHFKAGRSMRGPEAGSFWCATS